MKQSIYFLYFLTVCFLLTGCQQETLMELSDSSLILSLSDTEVEVTRSTPAEIGKPAAEKFHIKITKENGQVIYNDFFTSKPIPVSTGTYNLTATYGENVVIGWDTPYYEGNASVQVTKGPTGVTIPCKVANALLSVKFNNPEIFKQVYSTYGVKVETGQQSVMIEQATEKQSAYFQAGAVLKVSFVGKLKEGGNEVNQDLTESLKKSLQLSTPELSLQASEHARLTLTASSTIVKIEKATLKKETVNETIPQEWLPKPKVEGFANGVTTLNYVETNAAIPAAIAFTAATPIQDAEFTIALEDEHLKNLNGTYTLSTLTPEQRTLLESNGIVLPSTTATQSALDLTQLTANLQTNAGVTTHNKVTLRIKANNRWSHDAANTPIYTIETVKPEFSINVQPGNVWTKEFTIDEIKVTSGNVEKIKSNLLYQYSTDNGATWHNCNNGHIQKFATWPAEKNYKIKAIYRNAINSSNMVDATLESPVQLPNSDMEEWFIEKKIKTGTLSPKKTYYTFHPYTVGNENNSWWDTNNNQAQGGTLAFGIWYEGCFASCVSYTEDVHNGSKAALIYLSGCGSNYANTAGTYVGGAMVGSLFIGKYNGGIVEGHDFASRPTNLSFWYKYKPHQTDAFKVLIKLKNGTQEIATGVFEPQAYSAEDSQYQQANVTLNYTSTADKATSICLQFLASNKTSLSKNDFAMGTTINYPTIGNWKVHMGSVLKIDDISLIYDK